MTLKNIFTRAGFLRNEAEINDLKVSYSSTTNSKHIFSQKTSQSLVSAKNEEKDLKEEIQNLKSRLEKCEKVNKRKFLFSF